MSIFYNTIKRSARELYDFALLFFLVTFVMSMCGYIIFGHGASHPLFETLSISIGTTLGIAFGHIDHDTIIGGIFGIDLFMANLFY